MRPAKTLKQSTPTPTPVPTTITIVSSALTQ